MGRIPTITTEVAARTGRSGANVPSPNASPDAFGAAQGRALQTLGGGIDDMARSLYAVHQRRRDEEVANRVALADFTSRELQLRNEVGADGAGYHDTVLREYENFISEQANEIDDDATRAEFTRRMRLQRLNVSSRAAQYEFGAASEYATNQTNASITALDNRIRLQPDQYDILVQQGVDVIMAQSNVPATVRDRMATAWRQNSAAARFDGLMESAQTVDDVNALEAQLNGTGSDRRQWGAEMSTADLARISNSLGTMRRAIRTQADTNARAAIDGLEERASDLTVAIPREELQAAQRLVQLSENPVTHARMARIMRDQELARQYRRSPPTQIEAAANAVLGSGDTSTQGERRALDDAGREFGVSLEFMTRTGAASAPVRLSGAAASAPPNERIQTIIGRAVQGVLGPGATVTVSSGHRPGDTGSQHSVGGAADFTITRADGTVVRWNDPEAREVALAAARLGAQGFGAGPSYMGGASFHFDTGEGGATAPRRGGVTVWSDDDGAGHSSGGPGAAEWYADLVAAQASGESAGLRVDVDQAFIDRALATPGVRQALAGDESPARVVAAYAAHSSAYLRQYLGRAASDEELYMAHVMGVEDAAALIAAQADGNPEAVARYRDMTVQYAEAGPGGGVTASAYSAAETMRRMASEARTRINDDPMDFAARTGIVDLTSLNEDGGWQRRGEDVRSVAEYYSIPMDEMQPFTNAEETELGRAMSDGGADDVLEILTQVQAMGSDVARAAIRQISDLDGVYGYAAGLQYETGSGSVASEVVRGQKRIEENPAIVEQIGAPDYQISAAFATETGAALYGIAPAQRQAIMDAAIAHYVETRVARGVTGAFNSGAFRDSIAAVMGTGERNGLNLETVNGRQTVLPTGISGEQVETAFRSMTSADWTSISATRTPPMYADGTQAEASDLANEATLSYIGGGQYRVAVDDGTFLVTSGAAQNGRLQAFIVTSTSLQRYISRPQPSLDMSPSMTPGTPPQAGQTTTDSLDTLTPAEVEALMRRYGVGIVPPR